MTSVYIIVQACTRFDRGPRFSLRFRKFIYN